MALERELHSRRLNRTPSSVNLQVASVFNSENALKDEVAAGEKALLQLHNAGSPESLDSLRYSRFCQRVAPGKASLQPENLPPTSSVASFHGQRVYLQYTNGGETHYSHKTGAGSCVTALYAYSHRSSTRTRTTVGNHSMQLQNGLQYTAMFVQDEWA